MKIIFSKRGYVFFILVAVSGLYPILAQQSKADSLNKILLSTKEDTTRLKLLNSISGEFLNSNNYLFTIKYADQAISLASELSSKNKEEVVRILCTKELSKAYNSIGHAHFRQANNIEALKNYSAALKLKQQLGDKAGMVNSYIGIGNVYVDQGNYSEALKKYFNCLELGVNGDKNNLAVIYNNIAIVYAYQKNYPEALKNYATSLQLMKETGNKKSLINIYNNVGNIYFESDNYSKASENYSLALKMSEELNDKNSLALTYGSIGDLYYSQKNYPEALKSHFAALKIEEEINIKKYTAYTLISIGRTYVQLNKITEAGIYTNRGLNLSKEIGNKDLIKTSYAALVLVDSAAGNYQQAFEHSKLFNVYKDSLLNTENTKAIVRTEMNYEFEKKEAIEKAEKEKKDILAAAEKRNQKILFYLIIGSLLGIVIVFYVLSKNRRIRLENKLLQLEHNALTQQMNPHFIFNCLTSIGNYVSKNNPLVAKKYLAKFGLLMRLTLEHSRSQHVPLNEEIELLENYLELEKLRFEKEFNYSIIVGEGINRDNCFIPSMLIQPHIENSIIHGLINADSASLITINFQKYTDNVIHCAVEDNGVGRMNSGRDKTESTKKHKSLAVVIMRERYEIMNKNRRQKLRIFIEDKKNSLGESTGTKIVFDLPFQID